MTSEAEDLRRQLKEAHMSRALVYAAFYDALAERFDAETAEEVMKRAIYRRGLEVGKRFAAYGPADLAGLCAAFLDFVPDGGRLFEPEVRRADDEALDIKFRACPLKEAWLTAGLADDKIQTLCRIAGVVDNGTFEAAGFSFQRRDLAAGRSRLLLSPHPAGRSQRRLSGG